MEIKFEKLEVGQSFWLYPELVNQPEFAYKKILPQGYQTTAGRVYLISKEEPVYI